MPALVVVTTFGQQTFDPRRHHGAGFWDWSGQSFGRHMKMIGLEDRGHVVTPISSLQQLFVKQDISLR